MTMLLENALRLIFTPRTVFHVGEYCEYRLLDKMHEINLASWKTLTVEHAWNEHDDEAITLFN